MAQVTEFPFQAVKSATDVWSVKLRFHGRLYGGMNASREALAKRPWKERNEELRKIAQEVNEAALPDGEGAGPQQTVFRRDEQGQIAISAGQIRSCLQEVGRSDLIKQPNYYVLRLALRANLRVEPTLIPLGRIGAMLTEPDGIDYIPRPIRRPPFERSVIHEPEYADEVTVAFDIYVGRYGSGTSITDAVLWYLFTKGGEFGGLGAHRGLTDHEAGKFEIISWEHWELEGLKLPTIPPSGSTRGRRQVAEEPDDTNDNVDATVSATSAVRA